MKKILKFILINGLIFSMILPSYAKLPNSDGSSFVTKAEFDSALAGFNTRLTTFESGINSKIDSQVTSYLDRNGIWSGKEQKLYNGVKSFCYIQNVASDGTENKTVWYPYRTLASGGSTQAYYDIVNTTTANHHSFVQPADEVKVAVESVTKSGLFVMPYTARFEYCNDSNNFAAFKNNVMVTDANTGRGAHYWLHQYFKDGGENSTKELSSFATTIKVWEGLYYGKTSLTTSSNYEFNQHFIIKEEVHGTQVVRYDSSMNILKGAASTYGAESGSGSAGMRMWVATFGDPIVEKVAMFFVSKGDKLYFTSHIDFTGWEKDVAYFHQFNTGCSPMCMVIKPTSYIVY